MWINVVSNLKRSKRTVGKRVNDLSKRVSRIQKNPAPRQLSPSAVVTGNLAPGAVGGWVVDEDSLYTGTKTGTGSYAPTGSVTIGSDGHITASKFRIDANGDAFFSGTLSAATGVIAGWTIDSTKISSGTNVVGSTQNTYVELNADVGIYMTKYTGSYWGQGYYVTVDIVYNSSGIDVSGDASGTTRTTNISPSYVFSGGSVRHGDVDSNDRFYGSGTYTRVGDGSGDTLGGQNYSFRVVNGTDLYDQSLTTTRKIVYMTSSSTLGYDGSSLRFKQNVEPLSIDYRTVLAIKPVTFKFKEEVAAVGEENAEIEIGIIAEQADEVGFSILTTRGSDGLIDGFRYEKLPVYLLEVCRRQEEAIDSLKERVAVLEAN